MLNGDNDDENGTNKEYANHILSRVKVRKKTELLLKCMLNSRAYRTSINIRQIGIILQSIGLKVNHVKTL